MCLQQEIYNIVGANEEGGVSTGTLAVNSLAVLRSVHLWCADRQWGLCEWDEVGAISNATHAAHITSRLLVMGC